MKYLATPLFTLFITVALLVQCSSSTSGGSRRPVTSIQFVQKKESYVLGDQILIKTNTIARKSNLKKVQLYLNGIFIEESVNAENQFAIETSKLSVGTHTLKISAENSEGEMGENYSKFTLLSDVTPEQYGYKIKSKFPHNNKFFTQGLEFFNNELYEGTGQEGESAIYKVNYQTGKILKEHHLDNQYFGEGITILNNKLYQISYKHQTGFIYDVNSFELLKTWNFKQKEGWGLTNDGKSLIMSDGSENLYFINPESLKEEKIIQVANHKGLIKSINELEYINGEIWANIWTTEKIIRINPENGKIIAEIDLNGISLQIPSDQRSSIDVFNGIAYNKNSDRLFVTGKLWPLIFEIEIFKR